MGEEGIWGGGNGWIELGGGEGNWGHINGGGREEIKGGWKGWGRGLEKHGWVERVVAAAGGVGDGLVCKEIIYFIIIIVFRFCPKR